MLEKTTEITLAVEGTVTITTAEYKELIVCQTMLDLLVESMGSYGLPDGAIMKSVAALRRPPVDTPPEEAEPDA